ncbi:hypothetical protein NPIL_257811 [Nephila pilipes]|uniref:Uncharacterized protein n=1 Tax=Nephila pilipes TaxID=299642 RepID=A0A8X6NBX3_NEPPI|nr:hypothetical protein NPIL_257811 [Nephila pilipes]
MPGKKMVKRGLPTRFQELEKTLMEWVVDKKQQAHKNVLEEVQVAQEFESSRESSSAKIDFRRIQGGNLNKENSHLQIFRELAEEFTKDQEKSPTDAVDEEEATWRTARKKTRIPKGKTLQKETSFRTVEKSENRFSVELLRERERRCSETGPGRPPTEVTKETRHT